MGLAITISASSVSHLRCRCAEPEPRRHWPPRAGFALDEKKRQVK